MADISGIKQALAQTQALEQVQEAARKRGEQQQQSFAVTLNRQVDKREHQVNEGDASEGEEREPGVRKGKGDGAGEDPRGEREKEPPAGSEDEEGEIGRHVDAHA